MRSGRQEKSPRKAKPEGTGAGVSSMTSRDAASSSIGGGTGLPPCAMHYETGVPYCLRTQLMRPCNTGSFIVML